MSTFDEIAILDLHGNSKTFEQADSGEPDKISSQFKWEWRYRL